MARIRMIKPEFFDDPQVGELTPLARLFFIGLWTQADSAGRLEDDMQRLKARLFPYDNIDCEPLAVELHGKNMIRRYKTGLAVEKHGFIWICNFVKHQRPHPKEPASVIPPYSDQAVEKHGEPWKNGTNLPESGSCFLDTESGIRNLESGTRKLDSDIAPTALLSADADFEAFRQEYPTSRRVGGKLALRAWYTATKGRNGTHLELMRAALEQHKRSEQWQTPKLIPLMTTWLNQERWNQTLPEPKGFGVTAKTAGNAAALQRFVDKHR